MRGLTAKVGLLLLVAAPAVAWDRMAPADLAGHRVTYSDAVQSFAADGGTIYKSENPSSGHWRDQGGRYCSVWPPSEHWVCYGLERDGQKVRFVADDGSATEGVID